jgi:hypothetical protein
MRKIQVLFPEPQMERMRKVARLEDRPISEIIRRATGEYLAKAPAVLPRDTPLVIPVFRGGKTLISADRFRDMSNSDRTGERP